MELNINEIVKDEDGFRDDLNDEVRFYIIKAWLMDRVYKIFLLDPNHNLHIKNSRNQKILAFLIQFISSAHINRKKDRDAFLKYIEK
jgi:hypothetical protein